MLTKKEALILGRLTRNLVSAEIEYAWRGRGDRETIEWAEALRKKARKRYFDYLKKITESLSKVLPSIASPIDYDNDPRVHGE